MKNIKTIPMSHEEAAIIAGAVKNALCWGTGILTDWHVEYVFENYVDEQ